MAKPKAPDPVAWAKATQKNRGGVRCGTCSDTAVIAVLKEWIPMWKSGEIQISVEQAAKYLAEHYGYGFAGHTLRSCLRNHHGLVIRG